MKGYASRTATKRNIAALSAADWGWMVGPLDQRGPTIKGGMSHALDNGAWPAFVNGLPWDESAFVDALKQFGSTADFLVCPDVVADRKASLLRTEAWLPELIGNAELANVPILIAVQDGMKPDDILPYMNDRTGIFVGGTSEWKEETLPVWGGVSKSRGCHLHCGRVNTVRRIYLCKASSVDTFDGTSATRYSKTLWTLNLASKQIDWIGQ